MTSIMAGFLASDIVDEAKNVLDDHHIQVHDMPPVICGAASGAAPSEQSVPVPVA
jgi:hypothetical protein